MKEDTENSSVSFFFGECNVAIFAAGKKDSLLVVF